MASKITIGNQYDQVGNCKYLSEKLIFRMTNKTAICNWHELVNFCKYLGRKAKFQVNQS